jgi:glutaredoxin-like protein
MATFSDTDRKRIQELLAVMEQPVRLIYFTQTFACELCGETKALLEDLASLSDKLSLVTYNLSLDNDKVAEYRIDKAPATVIEGAKDYGVRLYGFPAGYEMVVLLEAILRVSRGKSGLTPESIQKLRNLKAPLHIEVFVTPTCPYCPAAARLAHRLAIESDLITADMVEATEFPGLMRRYKVRGVPRTVINGAAFVEGSLPESDYIDEIIRSRRAQTLGAGQGYVLSRRKFLWKTGANKCYMVDRVNMVCQSDTSAHGKRVRTPIINGGHALKATIRQDP